MFKKLGAVFALSALFITGCSCEPTVVEPEGYEGVYSYSSAYGNTYGAKVKVEIDKDTKKVTKVHLYDDTDEMTNLSGALGTWTEEDRANWNDNKVEFLKSFEGLTLEEIMSIEVPTNEDGEPNGLEEDATGYGTFDVVAGATQSSGRVIKAV
ncbi:TPA: FMN-binding protein [bacterium]|nr:FMN-binding protein [bacterium]